MQACPKVTNHTSNYFLPPLKFFFLFFFFFFFFPHPFFLLSFSSLLYSHLLLSPSQRRPASRGPKCRPLPQHATHNHFSKIYSQPNLMRSSYKLDPKGTISFLPSHFLVFFPYERKCSLFGHVISESDEGVTIGVHNIASHPNHCKTAVCCILA